MRDGQLCQVPLERIVATQREVDSMNFVPLKSGIFQMGDSLGQGFIEDHEAPPVMKKVLAFEIADTTVTNREFKAFVDTIYTTTAETIGDS